MSDSPTLSSRSSNRIGIAADHGGFDLKKHLVGLLQEAGYEIIDYGNVRLVPDDD